MAKLRVGEEKGSGAGGAEAGEGGSRENAEAGVRGRGRADGTEKLKLMEYRKICYCGMWRNMVKFIT